MNNCRFRELSKKFIRLCFLFLSANVGFFGTGIVSAHCDAIDGVVVQDARKALQQEVVTPLLKWISPSDESQLQEVFQHVLGARDEGGEAQQVADRYLFETAVRLHRASEGAGFTGLQPAGQVEPVVQQADRALEQGSPDELVRHLQQAVEQGVRERFAKAQKLQSVSDENVEAAREAVGDYVEYIHYVKRLQEDATTPAAHSTNDEAGHQGAHSAGPHAAAHEQAATPSAQLEKEHELTRLVLTETAEAVEAMEQGDAVETARVEKMLDFFINFVDACHHVKEEQYYFPAVLEVEPGAEPTVEKLKQQHARGRELLQNAQAALQDEGETTRDPQLRQSLSQYVEMLDEHIETENEEVFASAEKQLSEPKQEQLLEEFERLELQVLGEGFHEKYHGLAMELTGQVEGH